MNKNNNNSVQKAMAAQNEQLKAQLMATSLISEIVKVMLSSPRIEHVFRTMILGIQETMGFERVILFEIDKEGFKLKSKMAAGIDEEVAGEVEIPLSFMGGACADAVFLNRHIIVDIVDKDVDPIAKLDSESYLAIPIVRKISKNCWESKSCMHKECPAHNAHNPCCWSTLGSGLRNQTATEDERRQACLDCDMFACVGVMWMDKPGAKTLVTSEQMTTLTTLAYQAGIIIDNFEMYNAVEEANSNLKEINDRLAKMNDDLNRAQAKINKDLDHAQTIQAGLMPLEFSDIGSIKIGSRYIPASQVGGDYYDFFRLDEDRYGLVIADVSGHGVAAAMIMAMTKVLLKTFSKQISSPQETLERINDIFQNDIKSDNFVTVFFGMINIKTKKINFVSAGHNPIIFFDKKQNNYELIKADGLFLGVFEDMMLCESSRDIKSGSRIVLYTDGLTEAENFRGEMYSLERLCAFSEDHSKKAPTEFIDELLKDLNSFTQGKDLEDDVTVLIIDF